MIYELLTVVGILGLACLGMGVVVVVKGWLRKKGEDVQYG